MRLANAFLWAACAVFAADQTKFDPKTVARGSTQFKSSCGFCHGEDATGNRGPDLVRSAALSHDQSGDTLGPLIRNGRPDKGMPAFSTLTAAQVSDIVVFLHSRAYESLHSNSVSNDYPLKKLLTGNAEAGRKYFEGVGGCSGCHSPSGDLHGIAAKYRPIELQQRFLYPANGAVRTATVTLPGGKTIEGNVVHSDEFEIAITGKDGWYQSFSRDAVKVEIHDPLAAHRALMPKYTDADVHNLFAYLETLK
jgi:cytochrome c oxidase cbb3-type subunit III